MTCQQTETPRVAGYSLSAPPSAERARPGAGCEDRPVAAEEEPDPDGAERLPGGTSGPNHRGGAHTPSP